MRSLLNRAIDGVPGSRFHRPYQGTFSSRTVQGRGYGPPPHPLGVRAGQRYWPRAASVREVLVVARVAGGRASVTAVENRRVRRSLAVARLLAIRADGQGRHYQFQGFLSRRYRAHAYVWALEDREAVLCVPEWHPSRPVRLPARLLPASAVYAGAWVFASCDLSASSAARLQLADLVSTTEPPACAVHPPALEPSGGRR